METYLVIFKKFYTYKLNNYYHRTTKRIMKAKDLMSLVRQIERLKYKRFCNFGYVESIEFLF